MSFSDRTYAVGDLAFGSPSSRSGTAVLFLLSSFVFALVARKNERRIKDEVPCCRRRKGAYARHGISSVSERLYDDPSYPAARPAPARRSSDARGRLRAGCPTGGSRR